MGIVMKPHSPCFSMCALPGMATRCFPPPPASGLVLRCANPSEATAEDVAALLLDMNIRDMVGLGFVGTAAGEPEACNGCACPLCGVRALLGVHYAGFPSAGVYVCEGHPPRLLRSTQCTHGSQPPRVAYLPWGAPPLSGRGTAL